jgi:hypothetical protein
MSSNYDAQTQEYVRDNLIKLVDGNGNFSGSGFFIEVNQQKYCITCHHCIYKMDMIFVEKFGKRYTTEWVEKYSNMKKDLAVLKVDNSPVESLLFTKEALPNLEVTVRGFSGEKINDFPEGTAVQSSLSENLFPLEIKGNDYKGSNKWNTKPEVYVNVFQCEGKFDIGFSGSPVCYKGNNKVIGIFAAVDENYGYVIPIQTLLEKFSIKPTPPITQEIDAVKPSAHLTSDAYALEDMLGYGLIVHACYTFLTHKDTKPPLCVSIQSPWGGGKTSFMRMLQEKLDPGSSRFTTGVEQDTKVEPKMENAIKTLKQLKANPKYEIRKPYYTVWFNAWKYHNSEQIWSGLADAIVTQVSEQFGEEKEQILMDLQCKRIDPERVESLVRNSEAKTWMENLRSHAKYYIIFGGITAATLTVDAISKGSILSGLGQWGVLISIVGGAALSAYDRFKSKKERQIIESQLILRDLLDVPNYSKRLTTEQQVEQDLKRLLGIIKNNSGKKESRLVIFIDDLDRCSPNHITEVLEALNLFISSEFQNSYFVLGMDPEFVSAAIEESYINVIRRLSPINQKVGLGWNFMNKFIQLPVILPRPEKKNIETYIESLLLEKKAKQVIKAPLIMGSAVELETADKEFLKGQKAAIEKMDEAKETYSDQDPIVREVILKASKEFPNNPREMKRFLNILRFYYFIREGRKGAGLQYPSLDQIKRWIILVMKWPQVAVWLQKGITQRDTDNPVGEKLQGLEKNIAREESKQVTADATKEMQPTQQASKKGTNEFDILSLMNDKNLSLFFMNEISIKNKKSEEALSDANEKGLY